MLKAGGNLSFCHACFSGQYPTSIPDDIVQLRHAAPSAAGVR
jgi:glutamine phosphoribosylpyrophosphate amidotransferase